MTKGYWFELAAEGGADLSDTERSELLQSVADEAGLDESAFETGPAGRRLSAEDALIWVAVGSLVVNSARGLLQLYQVTKQRDDVQVRSMKVEDGPMIFAENVDGDLLEKHNVTEIGEVKGDVVFLDDADDHTEFISDIHDAEGQSEDDEEE